MIGRTRNTDLAWDAPNVAGAQTLALTSPAFGNGHPMPAVHASKRAGGLDLSPALAWSAPPSGTAQLLLVVQDPDAPTRRPIVHCLALVEPSLHGVPQGALNADASEPGVRLLRSDLGRGYHGPAPLRGHGPHRYVFQLFDLAASMGSMSVAEAG